MNRVLAIVGAGGHSKVVADIALLNGVTDILFFDDVKTIGSLHYGFPVVGKLSDISEFETKAEEVFVGIGSNPVRQQVLAGLKLDGWRIATLMHPKAVVSNSARVNEGSVIMANVVVNAGSIIGEGVILNTACTIDHDCNIGNYSHISPGANLAGGVNLGACSWIGIGASVVQGISIGRGVTVGAGALVHMDLTEQGTYVGVPAKRIK